jgi:hypothetical protein
MPPRWRFHEAPQGDERTLHTRHFRVLPPIPWSPLIFLKAKGARLIEVEPGHPDRGIHVVPLRGDVFVADLKITLLSRGERSIVLGK